MSSSQMRILRDNYTRPIHSKEGQQLLDRDWGELVFHLNRLMQRGSLMENYAIKKLQEQIITQVSLTPNDLDCHRLRQNCHVSESATI